MRNEASAGAELTIDCIRKLALANHEVFVVETSTSVVSARGSHLMASVYDAAAAVTYVPFVMMMGPLRHRLTMTDDEDKSFVSLRSFAGLEDEPRPATAGGSWLSVG
jgi:hypothetical protein